MRKIFCVFVVSACWIGGCGQEQDLGDVLDEFQTVQQSVREAPSSPSDGEYKDLTLSELEALAQDLGIVLVPPTPVSEMPERVILPAPEPEDFVCTTTNDQNPPESLDSSSSRGFAPPRATYRPNFAPNLRRPIPPKSIRGGHIRENVPNPPEIIILQRAYRNAGCADDSRIDDPPCKNHPYRVAIDEDLALDDGCGRP